MSKAVDWKHPGILNRYEQGCRSPPPQSARWFCVLPEFRQFMSIYRCSPCSLCDGGAQLNSTLLPARRTRSAVRALPSYRLAATLRWRAHIHSGGVRRNCDDNRAASGRGYSLRDSRASILSRADRWWACDLPGVSWSFRGMTCSLPEHRSANPLASRSQSVKAG